MDRLPTRMHRPLVVTALLLLCPAPQHAQVYCSTVHPLPGDRVGTAEPLFPYAPSEAMRAARAAGIVIPTVVHVIHQGGAENISDAQVLSQLDVLNTDFQRLNADTALTRPLFRPVASDVGLTFCLATLDPHGQPTMGIDRVLTAVTDPLDLIAQHGWDPARYLNIYVMPAGGCFSSFPWGPAEEDGIFITHGRFGTNGSAGSEEYAEFARFGRTGTHEAGHYLGLYHTFSYLGDTVLCTGGDSICDTPPADMRWFVSECLDHGLNTNNEVPDRPDQVENYMDYNVDSCANMFTRGQRDRVAMCLDLYRPVLWSGTNLVNTGCSNVTGIGERGPDEAPLLAPNPASSFVDIRRMPGLHPSVEVLTPTGERLSVPLDGTRIDVSGLANGLYLLRIGFPAKARTERLVVLH